MLFDLAGVVMNWRLTIVVLLLAVSTVACGRMGESVPEGTWVGQTAGLVRPGSFKETWTFEDGKITTDYDAVYTYTVDATKEPKQIDITRQVSSRGEDVMMGIYKIESDTLTICYVVPTRAKVGAKRPEDFSPMERDDAMVLTFRKESDRLVP
jgi:uncharacterized protein (TIGR03067 family)